MAKHVVIDTDIGGDPDDALALLFGLNSPEIRIELIVTSDEHKGHRAEFTRKLLQALKINVPVISGSNLGNNRCCVICDLIDADMDSENRKTSYLSAIKKVILRNSKTYYVCIGPQTNLAQFLRYAPELALKLEIVMMAGTVNYRKKGRAEHNIRYDVGSAREVFYSDADKRYVLSDTTFNPALQVDEHHSIYKRLLDSDSPAKKILLKNFQNFFRRFYPSTFMHDPLTLSYVINQEFLTFNQRKLELGTDGCMRLSEKGKLATVSTHADYPRFMGLLGQRLPFS